MIHSDFNGFSLFFTNLQLLSLKKIKIKFFKLKIVFKGIYLFLHDNQKNIVQLSDYSWEIKSQEVFRMIHFRHFAF